MAILAEASLTIQVGDLEGDRLRLLIQKIIKESAEEAKAIAVREVVQRVPVDTGALRGSISGNVIAQGGDIKITLGSPLGYAVPQELGFGGTGKGPPLAPLRLWAGRHNIKPFQSGDIGKILSTSIAQRRREGRFFFRDGIKAALPKIVRSITTRLSN